MKEFYVAPEAEVIRFIAEENIANTTDPTSVLDWLIEENQDGNVGTDNYNKWFK